MLISDYCATCNTSTCRMWQYIMKTNVKRLELFKYGLGAISSLQNYYYYYYYYYVIRLFYDGMYVIQYVLVN